MKEELERLTRDEQRQLSAMRRQISAGDLELRMFVEAQSGAEQEAYRLAERWMTDDWEDTVLKNDTYIRFQRAQIAAYQEWQEAKSNAGMGI